MWLLLQWKRFILKRLELLSNTATIFSCINTVAQSIDTRVFRSSTDNPGSVIVPQYGSSKITVFVWGKKLC